MVSEESPSMRPGAGFHPTVALPLETRFPVGEALFAHRRWEDAQHGEGRCGGPWR